MLDITAKIYNSPIGKLLLKANSKGICYSDFIATDDKTHYLNSSNHPILELATQELDAYFEGKIKNFSCLIDFTNKTDFQINVWENCSLIPFGSTLTYGELAQKINSPQSSRAVGRTLGSNPYLIFIPCHRVISQKGNLIDYKGGIERKKWLLDHERKFTMYANLLF